MRRYLALAASACILAACGGGGGGDGGPQIPADACASADNLTRVRGGGECIAIRTFGATASPRVLLVMVHGDVSAGGPADYLYPFAQTYAGNGVVSVAMLRPEYFDAQGNASTGENYDRADSYTEANIAAIAGAVTQLKQFHNASRVVYMGHSGGAAIGGVIAGKHPGVLDGVLLVSCPCDIPRWRQDRGTGAWPRSLSPHSFIGSVPLSLQLIALTGRSDPNTLPYLARDYVAALQQRGGNATFGEIAGATHDFSPGISQSADFDLALRSLLATR